MRKRFSRRPLHTQDWLLSNPMSLSLSVLYTRFPPRAAFTRATLVSLSFISHHTPSRGTGGCGTVVKPNQSLSLCWSHYSKGFCG